MNGFGRGDDKQNKGKLSVITRETVGMTLLLFSAVAFLIAVTGPYLFGDIGLAITSFFVGLLGFFVYPFLILVAYISVVMVSGKKFIAGKWLVRGGLLVASVFLIVHTATAERFASAGYGRYLSACWSAASAGAAGGTGGGVVFGVVTYPIRALFTEVGAYIVFAFLTLFALWYLLLLTPLKGMLLPRGYQRGARKSARQSREVRTEGTRPYPGGVSFEELPAPTRTTMSAEQPYSSAYESTPAAPSKRNINSEVRSANREILFGTDPAASYRNNLIYDKDSYFNTHRRQSNVVTPEPSEQMEERPVYPGNYSESYSARITEERPVMPRRVTEERNRATDGYSYPVAEEAFDANYPQTPSYRAQTESVAPANRDFYANDVTPEDFSTEPNVFDLPEEPESKEQFAPIVEPPAPPVPPAPPETPAPPQAEEPKETVQDREATFRSLFSRPVQERTRIDRSMGFGDVPASRFAPETPIEPEAPAAPEEPALPLRSSFRGEPSSRFAPVETPAPEEERPAESGRVFESPMRGSAANLFDSDDDFSEQGETLQDPAPELPARTRTLRSESFLERTPAAEPQREVAPPPPEPQKHVYKAYVRPNEDNFRAYDDAVSVPQEEIERNSATIIETLAGFRVDAEIIKVTCGSSVTRYDIDIPRNITVGTVTKRDAEIAMRLHARDGVNMYANNESGAISIEVPNAHRATVGIRSVLQAEEFVHAKEGSLMFVIGKDVEGRNVLGNIVKMKHILVAGSTGSGKSVCLNAMLISLICKYSPEDLRLILIDPKKVEFAVFEGLPHLMINEIIADAQKAVTALNWAIKEMERRYQLFEQKTKNQRVAVRNLDEYNSNLTEDEEKLPKIVIVVDELADLMSVAKKDIEERIQRIAQKARAAGIHLVIATQRPSVDVITGVIKGNLPTRMAFRVIQEVDSRTILDESGAEKLLGNGDMLYRTEGMFNCLRVQGAFLSSEEVQSIIEDIKANNEAYFDDTVADYINKPAASGGSDGGSDESDGSSADPQYIKALAIVVKLGQASISLIQRKLGVGYNHAGKIIEWMEMMGFISAFDGKAKARDVLLTKEEFEAKFGSLD